MLNFRAYRSPAKFRGAKYFANTKVVFNSKNFAPQIFQQDWYVYVCIVLMCVNVMCGMHGRPSQKSRHAVSAWESVGKCSSNVHVKGMFWELVRVYHDWDMNTTREMSHPKKDV